VEPHEKASFVTKTGKNEVTRPTIQPEPRKASLTSRVIWEWFLRIWMKLLPVVVKNFSRRDSCYEKRN